MRLFTLLLCLPLLLTAQEADLSTTLQDALDRQQLHMPQEKSYLRTDRTLYLPGETVWMAAYVVGSDHRVAGAQSDLLQLELLSPGGQVVQKRTIGRTGGVFAGDFQLTGEAPGGVYKIRAYTNYQGNFGQRYLFEKTIQVQRNLAPRLLMELETEREAYGPGDTVTAFFAVRDLQDQPLRNTAITYELRTGPTDQRTYSGTTNDQGTLRLAAHLPGDLATTDVQLSVRLQAAGQREQISRPVPVILDNIQLKFLPEGGEWVKGLSCRMAFIAKNEFGDPVDVAGTLYDADDRVVHTFSSLHDGMGTLLIPAGVPTPCRVRLHEPFAGKRVYPLPDPIVGNWHLTAEYHQGDVLQLTAQAKVAEELHFAIRAAGQLQDCQTWAVRPGEQTLEVDVSGLPLGIAQLTVFDRADRPVWERLVFIHPDRRLRVEFTTDREAYEYRQRVNLDLQVTDETGRGVTGDFSLAVIDDRLHSYADDRQPNILAQLLLSSELTGKIHEPNFYFDPDEALARPALDLLMLTHGWRRFHWQELLQHETADWQALVKYPPTRFQIQGRASLNSSPLTYAKLKLDLPTGPLEVVTDNYGRFTLDRGQAPLGVQVAFRYRGFSSTVTLHSNLPTDFHRKVKFQPDAQAQDQKRTLTFFDTEEPAPMDLAIRERQDKIRIESEFNFEDDQIELQEVVVTGGSRIGIQQDNTTSGMSVVRVEDFFGGDFVSMDVDMSEVVPGFRVFSGPANNFHATRQFAFPDYDRTAVRTREKVDRRSTIYWQAHLPTDANGRATASFFTADEMTTYRAIVEGLSNAGGIAYSEHTFAATPPLAIQLKLPAFATTGDTLLVPVLLQNNGTRSLEVPLIAALTGTGLEWLELPETQITLAAGDHYQLPARLRVVGREGTIGLRLNAGTGAQQVSTEAEIMVYPKGFPRSANAAGEAARARYELQIDQPIDGTITAQLQVFPDLMGELLAGIDALLAEPHGCFEQTSSANYPNIMVLQYLQNRGQLDADTRQRAWQLLAQGYGTLSSYEVAGGGFSLWGRNPAIPVLTAFGLLQFTDLAEVWPKVDPALIDRTTTWLREAYEQKQGLSLVDRAYILYVLSKCSDYRRDAELADLNRIIAEGNAPAYVQVIAARLNSLYGQPSLAEAQLKTLLAAYAEHQFTKENQSPTFVHTVGRHLQTELMAWTLLAALEIDADKYPVTTLMTDLTARRQGGRFGPTQPTVMALQAITAYERAFARPREAGQLLISVNQGATDTLSYHADSHGCLELTQLGRHFRKGINNIELRYLNTTTPLPYSLDVDWQTAEPPTAEDAPLALTTSLSKGRVGLSEQVRYHVKLRNRQAEEGYAPLLLLSAPAGLQWQLHQLKAMQERGEIDYYEIREPYLVVYFKAIGPRATLDLNFDLTAVVPGRYRAPAASAYLYYRDELKTWVPGATINITTD